MSEQIKKERKVFLDELPKVKGIRGNKNRLVFDWVSIKGYKIKFVYDDIQGVIEITSFDTKSQMLTVLYNEKEFSIKTSLFKKCQIGRILGVNTSEFKVEVGARFQDSNRDITIIDRKKMQSKNGKWYKYYKYICNKCEFDCGKHWSIKDRKYKNEHWILESALIGKQQSGCLCCCPSPQIVVENINSIIITDPWMIPYIGEECAKIHTCKSNDKVEVTCPDCGRLKNEKVAINHLYNNHSIGCSCNDSISYCEKSIFSILNQLKSDFKFQLTKKDYKWCDKYKYDFYFEYNNEQYIVETHGEQHYKNSFSRIKGAKTLEEEQENDRLKRELALSNGIKKDNYIIINCRKSTLEWIRDNEDGISNSKLNEIFDLSIIDWVEVGTFVLSNRVKEACEYWNSGINNTLMIANIMKLSNTTITKYLHQGKELNWCIDYDAKNILSERSRKNGLANGKQVEIFKDGISLGVFPSCVELSRQSEKLFKIKLNASHISSVCIGARKQHQGFIFKYVEEKKAC